MSKQMFCQLKNTQYSPMGATCVFFVIICISLDQILKIPISVLMDVLINYIVVLVYDCIVSLFVNTLRIYSFCISLLDRECLDA